MTGQDFSAFVIPTVCHHRQRFDLHRLTGLLGHRAKLITVVTDIGHLVRDDQMMLGIHRGLYVVTHDTFSATAHH